MADLQEIFRVEGLRLFNIAKLLKLRKEIHNITESNLRLDRHANATEIAADIEWMFNFDLRGWKNHIRTQCYDSYCVIHIGDTQHHSIKDICRKLINLLMFDHEIYVEQEWIDKYI